MRPANLGRGCNMMTRRSVGKTRVARSLWYAKKGVAELRAAPLPPPGPGQARVRTLFSGISRGTERLVFSGAVGESEWERMRGPMQEGCLPLPRQIRLLRRRSCRGGAGGAARTDGVLPASAPGLFQCPGRRPGGGAGGRSRPPGDPCRQHGNGPQRPVGRRCRARRPHRRRGCRRRRTAGDRARCPPAGRLGDGRRRGRLPPAPSSKRWALPLRRRTAPPARPTSSSMPAPRRPASTPPSPAPARKAPSSR